MKKLLLNIFTPLLVSIVSIFTLFNVPVSWFDWGSKDMVFGTTLTAIPGTTKISDLDTILTANFNALNNGKIENSTTSLPHITTLAGLTSASSLATVGTITSGVWSGTAILASKGGTGSTTLASNQLLLGNGTGILKTVSGFGNSGYFLQSAGANNPPVWAAAGTDVGADYTWTGFNIFSSALFSSTTITNTATTTIAGGISITQPGQGISFSDGTFFRTGTFSTTTIFLSTGTWTKPLGLTGNEEVFVRCWGGGGGGGKAVAAPNDSAGGGGGGGSYVEGRYRLDELPSSVSVTIGAGGASEIAGGNTTFGSYLTAFGGAKGVSAADNQFHAGGGGGGIISAGSTGQTTTGGTGGSPAGGVAGGLSGFGGGGGGNTNDNAGASFWGGGGGGGGDNAGSARGLGGLSRFGGCGGGGGNPFGAATAGGTCLVGGSGGAGGGGDSIGGTGTQPGGGGGGGSRTSSGTSAGGAGGAGRCDVFINF